MGQDRSDLPEELLAGIRREVERLRAVDVHKLAGDRLQAGIIRHRVEDARRGIVEVDLVTLLKRVPDGAERWAALRALQDLEASGRVELIKYYGQRLTHVRLVEECERSH